MEAKNNFICSISKKHTLKDTRILPCGALACKNCINDLIIDDGCLTCPECKKLHFIYSVEGLKSDSDLDKVIASMGKEITKETVGKMKQKIENLESKKNKPNTIKSPIKYLLI
jgi:hypothetical protein